MFKRVSLLVLMMLALSAISAQAVELPASYLDIRVDNSDTTIVRISHVVLDSLLSENIYSRGGSKDSGPELARVRHYVASFSEWQYPLIVGTADTTGWHTRSAKEWDRLDWSLAKARAQDARDHFGGLLAREVELRSFRGFKIYRIEIRSESIRSLPSLVAGVSQKNVVSIQEGSSTQEEKDGDQLAICSGGSVWSLRLGGEYSVVGDGRPVTTITVDLEIDHGDWMSNFSGGYLPQGDEDQRFAAFSLAYLPGHNKLGPVARIIYASRNETSSGGYLQEGYGPTAGLIFHDQDLTVYLTGGLSYFDRQRQSRRGEMTLNLGVKLHALSF